MYKFATTRYFFEKINKFQQREKNDCIDFLGKLYPFSDAKGLNLEKVCKDNKNQEIYSAKINDNYRAIFAKYDGIHYLVYADKHDDAYKFANKFNLSINQITGVMQLYNTEFITKTITKTESSVAKEVKPIFSLSKKELINIGVPEEQVDFIRNITDREDFFNNQHNFPCDVFENLSYILEDVATYDEILDEINKNKCEPVIEKALYNPITLKSFYVIESEEDLKKNIDDNFENWRVFLHETQRKIVEKDFNGPARVLGGAGTGKTVVAMHRANKLAKEVEDNKKILFTTFSKNLVYDIDRNLCKLCSAYEKSKIEIINFDAWIYEFLKKKGYKSKIIYDNKTLKDYWNKATIEAGFTAFKEDFYIEEYAIVIIPQEVSSEDDYIKAKRIGRGVSIKREDRRKIWKVVEAYRKLMIKNNFKDINTALFDAYHIIKDNSLSFYDHIIVDEGQDFSPMAYKILRLIAGEEHKNDLFIVGDKYQRIYKNKAVLSKCGINIRGRSSNLRINYRTTEENHKSAFALIKGMPVEDLEENDIDYQRSISLTHGHPPIIEKFNSEDEEIDFIVREINGLINNDVSPSNICIIARTQQILDRYKGKLEEKDIKVYLINSDEIEEGNEDFVRFATMHRAKGIEFQYVFILGVSKGALPLNTAMADANEFTKDEIIKQEKCLLYVAMTRAQKQTYITSAGSQSDFLELIK